MILVQFLKHLPQFLLANRRHIFEIAALKLLPANLTVTVEIDSFKLGL